MNLEKIPLYSSALLLQGPVGPFFRHLAAFLKRRGSEVYKINFNLGDDLFFRKDALRFKNDIEEFPEYLNALLDVTGVSAIFLFGDCRPIHRVAMRVAALRGVDVWVFGEGYIRPGYVTLELGSTNNHSRIPRSVNYYMANEAGREGEDVLPYLARYGYWKMACCKILYCGAAALGKWRYPHYRDHKPLPPNDRLCWAWSLVRKFLYRPGDVLTQAKLLRYHARKYFLVPLQVVNDASMTDHSQHDSVCNFISDVIESFAKRAPADALLVLTQDPMDRGYAHYGHHIVAAARQHGIAERVRYLRDGHAATLIRASRGVVLINGAVGAQVMYCGLRVKIMGMARYDIPGLTFEGELDDFWTARFHPDRAVANRFRAALVTMTQVTGNFYDRTWCRKVCDLEPSGAAFAALARNKVFAINETTCIAAIQKNSEASS